MDKFKRAGTYLESRLLRPGRYSRLSEEESLPEKKTDSIISNRKKAELSTPTKTQDPKSHKTVKEQPRNRSKNSTQTDKIGHSISSDENSSITHGASYLEVVSRLEEYEARIEWTIVEKELKVGLKGEFRPLLHGRLLSDAAFYLGLHPRFSHHGKLLLKLYNDLMKNSSEKSERSLSNSSSVDSEHAQEKSGNDTDTESHEDSSSVVSIEISEKNLVPQADPQSVSRTEPSHAAPLSPADGSRFKQATPGELLYARRLLSRPSESTTPDDRYRKSYRKTLADLKEAGLEIQWATDGDRWSVAVASGEFNNDRHAGLLARAARQFGKDSRNALRAHLLPELYEKLKREALLVKS